MKKRFISVVEAVVTAAIVLVLLQTMTEDILVLSGASWTVRRVFLFTGFGFDLFFTLEFLIRSWNAFNRKSFRHYFIRENGWVDFAASIPLLVFTSGPALFSLLAGSAFGGSGALIGMLKVVKAVRMARVLRLLRTAASTLIFSVTLIGTVFALADYTGTEDAWMMDQSAALSSLEVRPDWAAGPDNAEVWGKSRPSVMLLKDNDWTLYARSSDDYFQKYFGPGDYTVRQAGNYTVWFDLKPSAVSQSKLNLTVFLSTLAVVLMIMITYSPHFAITISDPVNVMIRGLREKSYNLEVSIPDEYREDDIFRLGAAFNDEYLPLKERNNIEDSGGGALDISLDDISDLLDS